MIKKLWIQNYALIDDLQINFHEGLTIITGETGAGKSILLGALGLILGGRLDTKAVLNAEKKCQVEALFDIERYGLKDFFEENDLDYDDNTLIRREITPNGKSRNFINDTPVSLNILSSFTQNLVHLHQQFDTSNIGDRQMQLRMVDALAMQSKEVAEYSFLFKKYQKLKDAYKALSLKYSAVNQESEFLKFQMHELSDARIKVGEEQSLNQEIRILENASTISMVSSKVGRMLTEEENNSLDQLRDLRQELHSIEKYDPKIESLIQRLENCQEELRDISSELIQISEKVEIDNEKLSKSKERLDQINNLLHKYKVFGSEDLISILSECEAKLASIDNSDMELEQMRLEITETEKTLMNQAELLSKKRIRSVGGFKDKVEDLLHQLQMPDAKMEIEVQPRKELGPFGIDDIQFLFSANKGRALQPIKDVASGGELSRLSLCIESLVAHAIPLPTLIFDEIDSGVSGEVAWRMGSILKDMATDHQVIVITHSPQVSAKSTHHWHVKKISKDGNTHTGILELDLEAKIYQIATMLSSDPPSLSAIETAKGLINPN